MEQAKLKEYGKLLSFISDIFNNINSGDYTEQLLIEHYAYKLMNIKNKIDEEFKMKAILANYNGKVNLNEERIFFIKELTRFRSVDSKFHSTPYSELTVISGDNSIGKTAFLISTFLNIVMEDIPVVFISPFSNADSLVNRIKDSLIEYNHNITENGGTALYPIDSLIEKIETLVTDNLITSNFKSIDEIKKRVLEIDFKEPVKYLIIDDIQFLRFDKDEPSIKKEDMIEVYSQLHQIARLNNIEILVSVNLSNTNSMKYPFIPELKDLSPNPSIFKYIDTVLFIRRPEFYGLTSDDEKESTYQLAQIYVNNIVKGSTQMCKLKYNSRCRLFEDFNTSNSFMKWDIEDDPF